MNTIRSALAAYLCAVEFWNLDRKEKMQWLGIYIVSNHAVLYAKWRSVSLKAELWEILL